MEPTESSSPDTSGDGWYEVCVRGHLDSRWAAWFDGLDLTRGSDGTTVLRGPVTDQAALHGLLQKVRDMGLPLVSVTPTRPRQSTRQAPARTSTEGERP